jgi:hypothetical protein
LISTAYRHFGLIAARRKIGGGVFLLVANHKTRSKLEPF